MRKAKTQIENYNLERTVNYFLYYNSVNYFSINFEDVRREHAVVFLAWLAHGSVDT